MGSRCLKDSSWWLLDGEVTSNEATAQILKPPRTPSPALDLGFVSRAVACFKGPCSASSFSSELGEQSAKASGDLVPFPEAERPPTPGRWPGASTLPCCSSLPTPGLGSQLGPQHHEYHAPAVGAHRLPRGRLGAGAPACRLRICSTAWGIDLEAQRTVKLESAQGLGRRGGPSFAGVH